MILKNIMEKLKTVLYSAYHACQEGLYYFTLLWVTVQYFIAYLLARLFNKDTNPKTFPRKDKKWHHGKYLFTVDFAHPDVNILDTDHSEIPHEHKCAHIIALDDGNFAAQPNNRCIWDLPSFTVKDNIPDWKVQTNTWNVEDTGQWKTEDTDKFFYEIEEKKHD
jgi:hypothetical protein